MHNKKKAWVIIPYKHTPHHTIFRFDGRWWKKEVGSITKANEVCEGKNPITKYFMDWDLVAMEVATMRVQDSGYVVKTLYV